MLLPGLVARVVGTVAGADHEPATALVDRAVALLQDSETDARSIGRRRG